MIYKFILLLSLIRDITKKLKFHPNIRKYMVLLHFLFIFVFSDAEAREIVRQTETTINGIPVITKQRTLVSNGKASIELEDNDSSKIEINEQADFLKNESDKSKDTEEKIIKRKKFKAFYKKPEKCLPPENSEIRIKCANDFIRKKAQFEELYKQGKI